MTGWSARKTSACPDAGTWIAPRATPSLGSSAPTRSLARASSGPCRRIPTRLLADVTSHGRPNTARRASSQNQSARGPGTAVQRHLAVVRRRDGRAVRGEHGSGDIAPHGEDVPGAQGCGTEPGQQVGFDRLPSTGATSTPPRTATYDPGGRGPGTPTRSSSPTARTSGRARPAGRRLPARPSHEHRPGRARDRRRRASPRRDTPARRPVTSIPAAPGELPTSRFARASAGRSAAPEMPTPRSLWPGRPWSCTVASAPGEQDR